MTDASDLVALFDAALRRDEDAVMIAVNSLAVDDLHAVMAAGDLIRAYGFKSLYARDGDSKDAS